MDRHSLLTVYEWVASRAEGLDVLVVGAGTVEGLVTLAERAKLVVAYERSKEVVAERSYRLGDLDNLFISAGGLSEAHQDVVNFDIVVALESSVPASWVRSIGGVMRARGKPKILIIRGRGNIAQPGEFSYESVLRVWGQRLTAVGSAPPESVEAVGWGEPIAHLLIASEEPIDEAWQATIQTGGEMGPGDMQETSESRDAQKLRQARAELDALLNDRAIRPILRGAAALRRLRRSIKRPASQLLPPSSSGERVNRATIEARIRALRPDAGPKDGPLVSIIVLTRNGAPLLSRLLRALEDNTTYRAFEVVVVDNGSSDNTQSLLRHDWSFPVQSIHNEENRPFSEGCNTGAETAKGDLLLFLNNDVEPINTGWLGAMVDSISDPGRQRAVGALLIHPEIHPTLAVPFAVQHRGVEFRWRDGRPVGVHMGVGDDPTDPALRLNQTVPALTGACLLIRREDFENAGRFTTGFVYGLEDVDLCLKMRELGVEMVFCGGAALFHRESTTQRRQSADLRNAKRLTNARLFDDRWKDQLSRWLLIDQLTGAGAWTGSRERIATLIVPADKFSTPTVAFTSGLSRLGWVVETKDPADALTSDVDLTIVTTGDFDPASLDNGGPTLAWPIDAAGRVDAAWARGFHAIAAPSSDIAHSLERALGHSVSVLLAGVDTKRFQPLEPELALRSHFAVVAPAALQSSIISDLVVRPDERFMIFGAGWEGLPEAEPYYRGTIDWTTLPALYSSIDILIHSATLDPDPSRSQILAATACGALVITDDARTAAEMFEGDLPLFGDAVELRALLDRYLSDSESRIRLVERLRNRVLDQHKPEVVARKAIDLVRAAIEEAGQQDSF